MNGDGSGCATVGMVVLVGGFIVFLVWLLHVASGPAAITAKYQCQQQVNGQQQPAQCVADSDGNSYYIPYTLWYNTHVGDRVDSIPSRYTAHTVPTEEIPAGERSIISEHVSGGESGGGEHGGFGGEVHVGGFGGK